VKYLTGLTSELGYASGQVWMGIIKDSDSVVRQLQRLVQQVEQSVAAEAARAPASNREQRKSKTDA
jgi:ArsR family metal-binding transcriptional regulator